jgi:hypothetical protein
MIAGWFRVELVATQYVKLLYPAILVFFTGYLIVFQDHIPRSCEGQSHRLALPKPTILRIPHLTFAEAGKDRKLDTRHAVEEAMTEALVRKCPNPTCGQSFLKESG